MRRGVCTMNINREDAMQVVRRGGERRGEDSVADDSEGSVAGDAYRGYDEVIMRRLRCLMGTSPGA